MKQFTKLVLVGIMLLAGFICLPSTQGTLAQTDTQWDDSFYLIGLDGAVHAIAQDGSDLYVGGEFRYADGIEVNHVAHWDGTQWFALGEGMDSTVLTLCVTYEASGDFSDYLFAGGRFLTADGNPASRVAVWDGDQWEAYGTGGLDSNCNVLFAAPWGMLTGDMIYAGGDFSGAIARCANSSDPWDLANGGIYGSSVNALTVKGTAWLIAGLSIGATARVEYHDMYAEWTLLEGDSPLEGGSVNALCWRANKLYAAGDLGIACAP